MSSRVEKLASTLKRTTSHFQEWGDPDVFLKHLAKIEREDRISGEFPYDDESIKGVKDFYAGKDILITGGSGFIGKVLIEKILRSLPEAGKVFLLLRGRKGFSPQQRVQAMLELPLFKLLMTENPEAAERLVTVEGDCGSLGLGLSPTDRQTLIDNVSVVFHCAATVRFDLAANHTILVNARGTREVVYLCKEMKKLASFVHISTAYSNATKGRITPIPEKVLRQSVDWQTVIAAAEQSERDCAECSVLDLVFEKMAPLHFNNYTLTKALAEDIIMDEAKDLPVIITRPPIVISTYEDPFGGWVDNMYGPMSVWDGIGQGIIRTHYGDKDNALEYQPVDMNVKNLIIAGWHRGIGFRTSADPDQVDVVNNGLADSETYTFNGYHEKMQTILDLRTHKTIFRYPRVHVTSSFWLFWLITISSHLLMGVLVDTVLRLQGKTPMLLKIYRKVYWAQTKFLAPFSLTAFTFDQKWQYKIRARMTKKEDINRFDWMVKVFHLAYYQDIIEGLIKYVFKEPAVTTDNSNRRMMYYLDWVHNALLAYLGWCICSWIVFRESTPV